MNPWASPGEPETCIDQTASAADTGALEVYRDRQERVKFGACREKTDVTLGCGKKSGTFASGIMKHKQDVARKCSQPTWVGID